MRNSNIERKGYTIINKNEKSPKHIQSLVDKVLLKTAAKKEHGLFGDIEILDFDLDRIYIKANDIEFDIRMWNIYNIPKGFRVVWTLFKFVPTEYGSCGKDLGCGESLVYTSK